jgi:hypothetical protein
MPLQLMQDLKGLKSLPRIEESDGIIQFHEWIGMLIEQPRIQLRDRAPIGVCKRMGHTVQVGNRGFQVVGRDLFAF